MEPILVYGFPAGSSMGLVAAFEQSQQPYRLCRVDMLADMKNDAYARLNGRQETPVLITPDGRVITETMAIAGWLADRDRGGHISYAAGTPQGDRMRQMMAFVNTGFTSAFTPLWLAFEREDASAAERAFYRELGGLLVADRHARLEAMIGDTGFLAGDRFTLADAVLIGVARWADFHELRDKAAYPRLEVLRARVEALPAVRFAMEIEEGLTPSGSGGFRGHVPLDDVLSRFREQRAAA